MAGNFNQIFVVIVIFLAATTDPSIHHVVGMPTQVRMSRRKLLETPERQAPRGFPPPQGNAFFNNPHRFPPPGRPFVEAPDGRPPAWIPGNARPVVPPPHT